MAKYDVVKEYDWTSAPRGSGIRKNAPRVWVKSYKLKSNQIMSAIKGFVAIAKGGSGDAESFYDKLYSDSSTPEDDFNFPFFSDNVRSFSNTFGDTFQSGSGAGAGLMGGVFDAAKQLAGTVAEAYGVTDTKSLGKAAGQLLNKDYSGAMSSIGNGGNPGAYIETPMFYQYEKNDNDLEVSFVLSNTINSDYDKNQALITKLTEINRPLRLNSVAVEPPRIYQIRVPGHRFIKWAYCSSFSVSFIGTRRLIADKIVPEGYQITMSFKSLTIEHAGFLKQV
jgi:hypothetical protein